MGIFNYFFNVSIQDRLVSWVQFWPAVRRKWRWVVSVVVLDHDAGLIENWATGIAKLTRTETWITIGIIAASRSHDVDIRMDLIIHGVLLVPKLPVNGVRVLTDTLIVLTPIYIAIYHQTPLNRQLVDHHWKMMMTSSDRSTRIRPIFFDPVSIRTLSLNLTAPPRQLTLTI